MKAYQLVAIMTFASCNTVKGTQSEARPEASTITSLVLSISTAAGDAIPTVRLISRAAGSGTLKKKENNEAYPSNYLTVYLYHRRQLTDSLRIVHPLYKHYEYLDNENKLAAKDTVIGKADFIVRFQTEKPTTEIRITETFVNKTTRQLSIIKL